MTNTSPRRAESTLAKGLQVGALAAVLGVIALAAQPGPGMLMSRTLDDTPTTTVQAGPSAEYFPAHFAAPSESAEQPATF